MRVFQRALGIILCLALPITFGAQQPSRNNPTGEWRYQSGDAWGTRFSPLDQINATNFEKLRGRVDLPRRQLRSRAVPELTLDAQLYQRHALHGRRSAPHRRRHGSRRPARSIWTYREPNTKRWERSMRAGYGKGVAYARDRRTRRHLRDHARLLPARDRREDRPTARELGTSRADCRASRKPASSTSSRISLQDWGAVAALDRRAPSSVRPRHGRSARARLHHELVAADRRQWRRHRRQLRRAGL